MPKYTPSYDDEEVSVSEEKDKSESSSATALIPKSVLGGKSCEIGDEITCKITAIHDDELQVEVSGYVESEKDETEEETEMPEDSEAVMPEDGSMETEQEPAVPQAAYE